MPEADQLPEIGDRVPGAEAVVAAALAAYEQQQWSLLVDLTDRDSLEELRQRFLEEKRQSWMHEWEVPAGFPDELVGFLQLAPPGPPTFHELAGISTLEEAVALSPSEFLIRWAQARHEEYLSVQGGMPPDPRTTARVVLGSVALLPDAVAVVVRSVNVCSRDVLGNTQLIAVLGSGRGEWRLDAACAWLGLVDRMP
ncbi:MAG: hypothetical protein IPK85_07155 [Gemmatimonadetes bacterium]|nr:hypothetical protein [Gemmatimonadota bacterium]